MNVSLTLSVVVGWRRAEEGGGKWLYLLLFHPHVSFLVCPQGCQIKWNLWVLQAQLCPFPSTLCPSLLVLPASCLWLRLYSETKWDLSGNFEATVRPRALVSRSTPGC